MTKFNLKRALKLVAGSLVIALVVSILPGSFLVNAAEVVNTEERAEVLAIEKIEEQIDDETVIVTVDEDIKLMDEDEDKPYYLVMVETDEDEKFEVKVFVNTGRVRVKAVEVVVEEEVEEEATEKNVSVFEDFAQFEAFVAEDFIAEKEYTEFNIEKPTVQAGLNELLRNAKLIAIAEFKENEDKEEAKANFESAKELIKVTKSKAKEAIKVENKLATTVKDVKEVKDVKDDNRIVESVKLTEAKVILIALNKVGVNIEDAQLKQLDTSDEYEDIFDDVDNIEINLINDKNPAVYIVEFEYDEFEYKIKVQSTTGKILDYEKEALEVEKEKKDKEVKEVKEVKELKEVKEVKEDKENNSKKIVK